MDDLQGLIDYQDEIFGQPDAPDDLANCPHQFTISLGFRVKATGRHIPVFYQCRFCGELRDADEDRPARAERDAMTAAK